MRKHSIINKINYLFVFLFSSFLFITGYELKAQSSHRVLFLGNSYTSVNDLPQIIHDVALSAGDTLIFDSNSPGGYQLVDHSLDVTSQTKIMNGGWDYVVIQGQSQEPVTLYNQFFNGGSAMYNQIKKYNPCAVTMPYMETISIKFTKYFIQEPIQIYSTFGLLIKSLTVTGSTTKINIADLANGLYYIRLKNDKHSAIKFIKL